MQTKNVILERLRGSKQAGRVAGSEKFDDLQRLLEHTWEWKQRFLDATMLLVCHLFSRQREVHLKAGACSHRLEKQGKSVPPQLLAMLGTGLILKLLFVLENR